MFDGRQRRVVSMWFPRLASDRVLRARPVDGPFALTLKDNNAERLYCLNPAAERLGLSRGMPFSDARAFCPDLVSRPADPRADARLLAVLRRWATRYCPWVGVEGVDGLVLDITGAAHLMGGEAGMLVDMRQRMGRAGIGLRLGLADTRGAAWALARHGEGVAAPGAPLDALGPLPVAALRLAPEAAVALQRLGLATIGALAEAPRAPLARRFGPGLMRRLDQALGDQPEPVAPAPEPPHYATRLTLPEPIGRVEDVMAGLSRLLPPLCEKLAQHEAGARAFRLTLRRVDQESREVELRLARPMRDPARIGPLFARGVAEVDAGYGIDQLRLQALGVEALPARQVTQMTERPADRLDDLITRIGTRIGLENVQRFLPADSHIPERAFLIAPAAFSRPEGPWHSPRPRPLRLFPPEPIAATGPHPPARFRWRRMGFTTGRATGPERLAPEWWLQDESWRRGLRDYWQVETAGGRRLWMFHTPQDPGWFVQGEFA
ncbi:DNA polymerase Y family protein [Paenirhodobacter sp. CAU 1674]|uniref:Y-family DNA polymerase n=1 Tax=Paenirhodobacter sp. CAU 1674 TaxID=3032596 RepID=UPI0023DAD955|nr:DNA polymerase Y family protein [Paenirhodobacter sp. CAU 1674]MDF2141490.1 DNA polymerase Y family protein [Paenirhodobacter sp. CAU 1674]